METRSGLSASQWSLGASCNSTAGGSSQHVEGERGNEASFLCVHRRVGLSAHVCGDYKSYPVYQEHPLTINMWAELKSTPAWLYKIKYVTVTTWRQEPWLSPLPYGYLNLLTLKSASGLQLSNCAALRMCLAESLKMNFQATYSLADFSDWQEVVPAEGKEDPCSVVAELSRGKEVIDFCLCSCLGTGVSH